MKCKVSMLKASSKNFKAMHAAGVKAAAVAGSFVLLDNEDETFTVLGVTAGGNTVDISDVATLEVVSDNTSILTVDPPVGMTSAMHAVGPLGTANLSVTATWNDGSLGPFSFTLPGEVKAGPVGGVVIDLGPPTSH